MRTLYDGFSFDVIREGETFRNGGFTTQTVTGPVQATNDRIGETRYRYIGDETESRSRTRPLETTKETSRYRGVGVTLYGRGEPVAMTRSAAATGRGGTANRGKDLLGSGRSTTNDQGALEDRYEYDAFGKPYRGDLSSGMNLGYTGKAYDVVTGLYNYGYRDYAPETVRFTTVDPIRDGANWFAYVNNDPVNFVDLFGLRPLTQEEIQHHKDNGGMPVDYTGINLEDEMPTRDAVKDALKSVGADMPSDNEIDNMIDNSGAFSLPGGDIYIPSDARNNPGAQDALLDSEINHQSQYQNGDPKQVVEQLMHEERTMHEAKYDDPNTKEYEAHKPERDYADQQNQSQAASCKN
jgi:RHS repeat-associated protein